MGKRKSSSLLSFCNIFKSCFSSDYKDDLQYSDENYYIKERMCPSAQGYYEPGIDDKASAFIAGFHASRGSDS